MCRAPLPLSYLLLVTATFAVIATASVSSSSFSQFEHRFQPFCNYVCKDSNVSSCPNPHQYDYMACNQTQTGNGCTLEGCWGWTQGIFPKLVEVTASSSESTDDIWRSNTTGKFYQVINGGVPQYGNLSLHSDALTETISQHIPPVDYTGNLVLDFEDWTPIWEQNTGSSDRFHSRIYQEYSLEKLTNAHPTWNSTKIVKEAARAFQSAATSWFVATLQTLRSLRPKARVGFYGLPQGHYKAITPDDYASTDPANVKMIRNLNDAIAPVFAASSALFPSVYLQPQGKNNTFDQWRVYNQQYVNASVYETIRLVKTYCSSRTPILPFWWAFYHNGSTLLLPQDVSMVAENIYSPPYSTALVQWGSSNNKDELSLWQTTVGGPLMRKAVAKVDSCSEEHCSGHGWCTRSSVYHSEKEGIKCICDQGYHGLLCDKTQQLTTTSA